MINRGRSFVYDPVGNLVSQKGGTVGPEVTYAWDAANRLVKVSMPGAVTEFVYDGLSRRVAEKYNGNIIKRWIWIGGDAQPAEERDASNAVTRRFYSGMGEQSGGTNYFYTVDHLGSVRELTDATGAVRARYAYDPYGRRTKVSGDLEASFGYTGYYQHSASGLGLALYRAFDARVGRFISRDPIEEKGGVNLYGYCSNDPINWIDPIGLAVWVEGPSGGEPTGHQSINVGDPNGNYCSYSFGVNGNGLEGEVDTDWDTGGPIEMYKQTTKSQDKAFKRFLDKQMGDKSLYGPTICRNWSQDNFNRAPGKEVKPPDRQPGKRTPFRKLTSSSKPSSTATSSTGSGPSK